MVKILLMTLINVVLNTLWSGIEWLCKMLNPQMKD